MIRARSQPMPKRSSGIRRNGRSTPVAVFGTGHLARTLLPLLPDAGYRPVAVCARRISAARSACRLVPHVAARATTCPASAIEDAVLVLLAVPDREISPLAQRLAGLPGIEWKGRVVLHHAGSAGPDLLQPLVDRGAGGAVMHPLQCLGQPEVAGDLLVGSRARIEGDRRGRPVATRLARALGLIPLRFPAEPTQDQRSAYHAAASLLSNDLVALLALGLDLMESAGVERGPALEGLASLARGTLLQAESTGPEGALTGPVARGDAETLRAQLESAGRVPTAAEVHRLLSLRLARLARARGSVAAARRIERALAGMSGRSATGTV